MEKDIDEVGKIARLAKAKVEELDRDVCYLLQIPMFLLQILMFYWPMFEEIQHHHRFYDVLVIDFEKVAHIF